MKIGHENENMKSMRIWKYENEVNLNTRSRFVTSLTVYFQEVPVLWKKIHRMKQSMVIRKLLSK